MGAIRQGGVGGTRLAIELLKGGTSTRRRDGTSVPRDAQLGRSPPPASHCRDRRLGLETASPSGSPGCLCARCRAPTAGRRRER